MVGFGIVGCGHIARKHAEQLQQIEHGNLVAVCDSRSEAMQPFIEKYGATGYQHYEDMLHDKRIQAVCICTPSGSHARLAIEAARAGKHVVVEKPMALSLEDADAIINHCHENGVQLTVVHPNRFRPAIVALRKMMDDGRFGRLSHVNATVRWNRNQQYYDSAPWRGTKAEDGGVLMNQAIHNLDLMLWIVGEPAEVFSMDATRFRQMETEDVSVGCVRFQNGALGVVEACVTVYPENFEESLTIFGEKGTIQIGGKTANFIKYLKIEGMDEKECQSLIEQIDRDPFGVPGHRRILEDFVEAIRTGRQPAVTGEEGRRALRFVLSFYESAARKQPIRLT